MKYLEKYKDPRWQKRRLEIMERDEWKCVSCNNKLKMLTVHHMKYNCDAEGPWDYPDSVLVTLCEECHSDCHSTPMYLPSVFQDLLDVGVLSLEWADKEWPNYLFSHKEPKD